MCIDELVQVQTLWPLTVLVSNGVHEDVAVIFAVVHRIVQSFTFDDASADVNARIGV